MKRGKKYVEVAKLVDKNKLYSLEEAVELAKKTARAKFDETVEISVRLGVDPKQAEQTIRGTVVLPHGIGKTPKILVLAKGEKVREAEAAGADLVGADDMIEKIKGGFLDFDVIVATPDMMKDLSKVGKVLGPKGLMPNPKTGTVTFELKNAIEEIKKGKIEYRVDAYGIVHNILGKASFEASGLKENCITLLKALMRAKPATLKGEYLKSVTISTTMGPGIKLDIPQVINLLKK
jgi:large subunit ribosomal protein L1